MNFRLIFTSALLILIATSCKKFIEVDSPITSVSSKDVYNTDATAIGAMTSLYANLSSGSPIYPVELTSLSCIGGVSADELDYYLAAGNQTLAVYYQNTLTSLNVGNDFFGKTFQRIYVTNAALEGLKMSAGLTPNVKQQLLGEAHFMRAFYYFYLVNLYGDVPLVLSSDYTTNAVIRKSSKMQVYNQIIEDLKEAKSLLSGGFLKGDLINLYSVGSEERVRPTKWAATFLLSRAYLFIGDWASAELQASIVLANTVQFRLESVDKVFLKNNEEAVWQLPSILYTYNTQEASVFILPDEGPSSSYPVYLNNELIKDFEVGDKRRANWIGSVNANGTTYYYPYKYKVKQSSSANAPITEYSTVMRLAELYLIRAESRTQLGKLSDAISDVDQIRTRAGLPLISDTKPTVGKDDLLALILNEKRIEFFTEWGHRWLDLKRIGKVDEVMTKVTPKKNNGTAWKSYQQYYPIWSYELQSNPNLVQTTGY